MVEECDRDELIYGGYIPLSKYWSTRLGFLDIISKEKYGNGIFVPLLARKAGFGERLSDDLKVVVRIYDEWLSKDEHKVGEAGAVYRALQFYSWKHGLNKKFIKEGTLKDRKMCKNSKIISWPLEKLVKLDHKTPQWASASILCGCKDEFPSNYFLNLSKEAVGHYKYCRKKGKDCDLRIDYTILGQAMAFIDILQGKPSDFIAQHQDDYCFSRAFELVDKKEGLSRWPELQGHESNRLEEMEKMLLKLENNEKIDSKDHRVVQVIAMLALLEEKKIKFAHPSCVSKSWPQFWDFLELAKNKRL
jgi:hypothetical protein